MKRIIKSILFLSVFISGILLFSPSVSAQELTVSDEAILLPDNPESYDDEELFAEYFASEIEESVGSEDVLLQQSYGASRNSYLDASARAVYSSWLTQIRAVASGSVTSTIFQIPGSVFLPKSSYSFAELGITNESEITSNVLSNAAAPDMGNIYRALLNDCPYEMYWHDKTVGVALSYSFSYSVSGSNVMIENDSYIQVKMTVSSDYQGSTYTTDATKTGATSATIANATAIVNAVASATDYEKIVYYRDWITTHVSYNTSAVYTPTPYGDPWQIIYVFDGDNSTNVVCEGYSKAFKYLCDLSTFADSDIDCYLMTGSLDGGAHMWNTIYMDDDKYYMVDLTNYSSSYPNYLFLSGYVNTLSNGYVFHVQNATASYVYDSDCISSYTSAERTLSSTDYDPTAAHSPTSSTTTSTTTQTVYTDPVEAFVARMYRVVLLREPDSSGFAHWVNCLRDGTYTGADIMIGFYLSDEMIGRHLSNSDYVESAYLGIFNRSSDASGKATWTGALDAGTSYRCVVYGFTGSTEFTNLCNSYGIVRGNVTLTEARDQNIGVTGFVSRLYNKALGRGYDVSGLNDWCGQIVANPSRENVMNVSTNGFFHSQEFLNKNLSNGEFVKVLYRTYLGREYDADGYNYWVQKLDAGESRDSVIYGFAYSAEFSNIMAQYGL